MERLEICSTISWRQLDENSVFMDVDSIALGRDVRSVLQEILASCDLMLVLIGSDWADVKDEREDPVWEIPVISSA